MDKSPGWVALLNRRNGIEVGRIDEIQGGDSKKGDVAPPFILRLGADTEIIKASDCGGGRHARCKSGVIDRREG
jgi:hypothetical protein